MYLDLRTAKAQADYKREQLKKSYASANRRGNKAKKETPLDGNPMWLATWARLLLLNR